MRRVPPALAVATVLAALLAALRIGRESLWLDEGFSVALASQPWATWWRHVAAHEANMCAYHALLKVWIALGDGEAFVRALSALFAVATVPVQYFLARKLCGARVASVAALLLAGHVYLVRYGQDARAYAMVLFLSSLSSLLLVRALETPSARRWLAYALAGALLLHAHILGVLILAGHAAGVALFQPRSRWPRALAGFVVVGALSSPLFSFFVRHRGAGNIAWVPPPSVHQVLNVASDLAGMGAMPAIYLVALVAAVAAWRRDGIDQGSGTAAIWLALPPAALLALSLGVRPMFQAAYLIGVLPALTLLGAFGLTRLADRWLRVAAVAAVAASVGSLVWWYGADHKEDWRSAVAYVAAQSQPGDGLVILPPDLRFPVDYYLRRAPGAEQRIAPLYPAIPWGQMGDWDQFVSEAIERQPSVAAIARGRLWVLTPRDVHVPDARAPGLLAELAALGYRTDERRFFEIDVRLLSR
jgi:mannosyltransferase